VRFFERLPSGYFMTDAGERALAYAERIESEVHGLSREILGQDARLQGKVRVTAPEGFASNLAPRLLAEFCRLHEGVQVEIVGASSAVDLARREADIAIRATRKPPDAAFGRRVGGFRFAVYGAPSYIESHDELQLPDHAWCAMDGLIHWLVPLVWKKKDSGERRTVFKSSSVIAVLNAAAEGMGLTLLPCYLGDADGRIVRATAPIEGLDIELWLLTHPDLRHTARVKALMAFLYERLVVDRDLFAGERPQGKPRVTFDLPR
jgi:DNA-binding transcriptional LysR family regulator